METKNFQLDGTKNNFPDSLKQVLELSFNPEENKFFKDHGLHADAIKIISSILMNAYDHVSSILFMEDHEGRLNNDIALSLLEETLYYPISDYIKGLAYYNDELNKFFVEYPKK